MENRILGLHHVTAIAGDPLKNFKFYSHILGLRFIKKTVNFDDPGTYHFYFGDGEGTPGTILTFFPWGSGVPQGKRGAGMATEVAFSVPKGSLEAWVERFNKYNVIYNKPSSRFGERYLPFLDPDGLKLELVESVTEDNRAGWVTDEVGVDMAVKGFFNVTLTLNQAGPTATILTEVFGYKLAGKEVNRHRYVTDAVDTANVIDIVEIATEGRGHVANGTIHHVAFRVKDDETELKFRKIIADLGYNITHQIDRNYFHSLYFREPNGVLFEIATDNPGFTVDESVDELGTHLKLPAQYESQRAEIEKVLIPLN